MFVAVCTLVKEQYGKLRCRGQRNVAPTTPKPCLPCEVWKSARRESNEMTQSSVTTNTDIVLDGPEAALPTASRKAARPPTVSAAACDAATLQQRFQESRLLIAAIELGLFTVLADVSLTYNEIVERLHQEKSVSYGTTDPGEDFLNELVDLQLLHRHEDCNTIDTSTIHSKSVSNQEGDVTAVALAQTPVPPSPVQSQHYYSNSAAANLYLVKSKGPTYLGDTLLVHYGRRRYQLWCRYQETLLLPEDEALDGNVRTSCSSTLPTVRETKLYVRNKFQEMRHCDISPRHVFNVAHGLVPHMVVSTAQALHLVDVLSLSELTTTQIHQALHFQCRLERTVDFLETLVQYRVLASVQRDGKVYYCAIGTTAAVADADANEDTGRTI